MSFAQQIEAMGTALILIQKLPEGSVWSLTFTEDDTAESPSVLNIFAYEEVWPELISRLNLGRSVDRSTYGKGEQFMSFRQGTLLISFIEQEEKNVRNT